MIRSVAAVLAGWLSWGAVCVSVNALLMATMPTFFNEEGGSDLTGMNIFLLILMFGYSILSGIVTATVAAHHPMRHVLALAMFNLAFGTFMQLTSWTAHPVWFHVVFLISIVPGILLGGKLREMFQRQPKSGPATI